MVRQMNSQAKRTANVSQIFVTEADEVPRGSCRASGPQLEIPAGEVLADRYTVYRRLGAGGFGAVYLVKDAQLQQDLALKVVLADPGGPEDGLEQLVHEFKLRHQISDCAHIVRSYDPRSSAYRGLALVLLPMDLADGGSLRDWMNANEDIAQRREAALVLFKQACRGVQAIHAAGLAHLDIKPENILLVNGQAKVSDFGIGRYLGGQRAENPDRVLHSGVGTPQYMSPEQFQAARQAEIGPASDIYSLGLLLYELLDGAPPFDGVWQELRDKHLALRPPELRGPAAAWWPVVDRCLAKASHQRYPSVEQLLRDVDRAAAGNTVLADVACGQCGHLNANERSERCEQCGADLSSHFRECCKCGRRNRLDLDRCGVCGFEIAAHFLCEQRRQRVAKLQDESPAEAIELLELMLRDGAGEEAATLAKELRRKQDTIGSWMAEARENFALGALEEAADLWREVLTLIPRHRTALAEIEHLDQLTAQFQSLCSAARVAMEEARFEAAQDLLQEALELIPQRQEVRTQLAEARDHLKQYAAIRAEALAALRDKKLRSACHRVHDLLALAPRSPEALSLDQELHESLDQTKQLITAGKRHLARAEFGEARAVLRQVEQVQADHTGMTEFAAMLDQSQAEYERAMAEVIQARQRRDLDQAEGALQRARQICPSCPQVDRLGKAIGEDRRRASEWLDAAGDSIREARFEAAERGLAQAAGLCPQIEGLAAARQRLTATRRNYDQAMQRAQQAASHRDLGVALDSTQQALLLCPGSEQARSLSEKVQRDQAAARGHLQGVKALCEAAEFNTAAQRVNAARALWSTLRGLHEAEAELLAKRTAYGQEMEKIRRFSAIRQFQEARAACGRALEICPDAKEIESLEETLITEEVAERWRQAARRKKLAEYRTRILALAKKLAAIVVTLAVVAALGFGGRYLWQRWHDLTWQWFLDRPIVLAVGDGILLVLAALIHMARYTNLYRHIFQGVFHGLSDRQLAATGVVILLLIILCGGTSAAFVWLLFSHHKCTYEQALQYAAVLGGMLAFLMLTLSIMWPCGWRRV